LEVDSVVDSLAGRMRSRLSGGSDRHLECAGVITL